MRPKLPLRKPRSRVKDGPAFVFVDTTSASDAKTIVRRHAARSGLICRQENITTLPDSRESIPAATKAPGATSPAKNRHGMCKENTLRDASNLGSVPQPLSSRYEAFRLSYNFDITDLTSFTDVDLATNAYRLLQDEPNRLVSLLQKQSSSFLAYLPSRYGSSTCLDDAMHCVAARAGQVLGFQMPKSMPYILYGKALKSLQIAISDGTECTVSDIYCVTRLLVLYELIGPPDTTRLAHHHRGGIRLIELRGPDRYTSKFDWMLLKSQGPSIIIDEMYRKESSIFEAQEWQRVFQRASDLQSDSDCRLWWKYFGITGFLPGILKDLRNLLEDATHQSGYFVASSAILERAKVMHKALHNEHVFYQHAAPHPQSLFSLPVATESPDRIRLRVFFLYTIMYICRVLATLSPTEIERATREVEAQMFASQALLIEEVTTKLDPAMAWHLQQRNGLAHSIIEKKEEWFSDNELGMSRDKLKGFLAQRWLKWENSWRAGVLAEELGENEV
ncbi:hypothetical protein BFJ70_g16532 [Fusarium oxysporum]|uniref:Uncharacterized protein n=1 Tax=Fusarium oxysporum TaxID=5507 RepID=A0A420MA18_FUSOX|nr:hypothetical protein BFJ66_g15326 [Fusarium oxysporum f. sp. cepae]RKK63899.1 hypothetical protein BFJ69_g16811 [Fusarium oxysporum]RKK91051.1 hypothetical protein BFJ68_g16289 [Fusarium oxysporum]RKL10273.1 hypothetical protein BFJ70_g16532 [Fusarium oxysporum]